MGNSLINIYFSPIMKLKNNVILFFFYFFVPEFSAFFYVRTAFCHEKKSTYIKRHYEECMFYIAKTVFIVN